MEWNAQRQNDNSKNNQLRITRIKEERPFFINKAGMYYGGSPAPLPPAGTQILLNSFAVFTTWLSSITISSHTLPCMIQPE